METDKVKDWSSLFEFLISLFPADMIKEDIPPQLGMSRATFYNVLAGRITVGKRLGRELKGLLKERFGYDLKVMGKNVNIEKAQNVAVNHSSVAVNNAGRDIVNKDEMSQFLMHRLAELELENKKLREMLKK